MRHMLLILFLLFFSTIITGQSYQGPYPQITEGYGAFGNHPTADITFDNTWAVNTYGEHEGQEITIRYPSDIDGPLPTILFASGWNQHDPALFNKLLDFIASKGYAVVFTPYKTYSADWGQCLYHGMKQAIDEHSDIIDTLKLGIFGHSLGGGYVFWLGKKFYVDHGYGQNGKFLFSVAGWIGFDITREELASFPDDCALLVEIWEEDDYDAEADPTGGTSPRIQYDLFYNINIPSSEKNYIRVLGGPDQDGYHYDTHHSLVLSDPFDALDYYAIFQKMDALIDYKFNGNADAKNIALGFDTSMGSFPDLDTDYDTFVFAHPEDSYKYPCDVEANPHRDYCPNAPLDIETLNPLQAHQQDETVVLTWSTASEIDNAGFEIQRSQDGIRWEKIGWVEGHYSTTEVHSYKAIDKKPLQGINYYRFKQLDFDDKFSFSDVVSISFKSRQRVKIFPNPGDGYYFFKSLDDRRINFIVITDISNKTVKKLIPSGNSFDVSDLPKGMYFANFYTSDRVIPKKIIIR